MRGSNDNVSWIGWVSRWSKHSACHYPLYMAHGTKWTSHPSSTNSIVLCDGSVVSFLLAGAYEDLLQFKVRLCLSELVIQMVPVDWVSFGLLMKQHITILCRHSRCRYPPDDVAITSIRNFNNADCEQEKPFCEKKKRLINKHVDKKKRENSFSSIWLMLRTFSAWSSHHQLYAPYRSLMCCCFSVFGIGSNWFRVTSQHSGRRTVPCLGRPPCVHTKPRTSIPTNLHATMPSTMQWAHSPHTHPQEKRHIRMDTIGAVTQANCFWQRWRRLGAHPRPTVEKRQYTHKRSHACLQI